MKVVDHIIILQCLKHKNNLKNLKNLAVMCNVTAVFAAVCRAHPSVYRQMLVCVRVHSSNLHQLGIFHHCCYPTTNAGLQTRYAKLVISESLCIVQLFMFYTHRVLTKDIICLVHSFISVVEQL